MKKLVFLLLSVIILFGSSCADSKSFKTSKGTVEAEPYGLLNEDQKKDGVEYKICKPNVVLAVLLSGSLVVPIYVVGFELYEPKSINLNDSIK